MIINFDPTFNVNGKTLKQHELLSNWNNPYTLAKQFAKDMSEISYNNVNYNIAEKIELNEMPRSTAVKKAPYTTVDYYKTLMTAISKTDGAYWNYDGWKDYGFTFDYDYYFTKYKVYEKVNRKKIDEVWFFGGPMTGVTMYETIMVGKDAFWVNGSPLKKNCRNFVAYGFNYERGVGEMLEDAGCTFQSTSDTEVIVKLIARSYKKGLEKALTDTIQMIKGSFALAVMTDKCLIGARDPNGIRPLCLGQTEKGWILASESCAIDAVNGTFVRDINPGEIVIINDDGVLSFEFGERTSKRTCVFEYVYFARPDSVIDGIPVQHARYALGAQLARESGVPADVVVGVPDSGLGAAVGYAKESGIPYATGIIKNKYIGRTFIAPTQKERENMVFVKLNAVPCDVKGKRVIIIDDSIVRGTTSKRLVQILRRAGATEVHFRISSPPVKFPCYFGINTPTRGELISAAHDTEAIRKMIGADSLAFLSPEGLMEAVKSVNPDSYGFCKGCFTGEYPMACPEND